MAKKNKDQEPTVTINSVTNRDILQRLNFLYQAGTYLNSISSPRDTISADRRNEILCLGEPSRARKQEKRRKERHPATTAELSRSYVKSMKIIGQKTTVRMDPNVKRTICKSCNTILVPGTTALVRVRPSPAHGHVVSYICTSCKTKRNIPAPPVLDPDALPESSSTSAPPLPSHPAQAVIEDQSSAEDVMQIDEADPEGPAASLPGRKGKRTRRPKGPGKRRPQPRLAPLFQRKGHVIFRGNDKLDDDGTI